MKNLKGGTKVKLLADEAEGWLEEYGTLCGYQDENAMDEVSETYIVSLDEQYRGKDDYGLREVSEDQVVPLPVVSPQPDGSTSV
jgi:hypothetical protein